jgi:hypothetical protein
MLRITWLFVLFHFAKNYRIRANSAKGKEKKITLWFFSCFHRYVFLKTNTRGQKMYYLEHLHRGAPKFGGPSDRKVLTPAVSIRYHGPNKNADELQLNPV